MGNADTSGSSNLDSVCSMGVSQDLLNHLNPMLRIGTYNEPNLQGM